MTCLRNIGEWSALFVCVLVLTPALARADAGSAPAKPVATSTRTTMVAVALSGLSREELELAAHLELLQDFELFENWELLSVMPALEEDRDD